MQRVFSEFKSHQPRHNMKKHVMKCIDSVIRMHSHTSVNDLMNNRGVQNIFLILRRHAYYKVLKVKMKLFKSPKYTTLCLKGTKNTTFHLKY